MKKKIEIFEIRVLKFAIRMIIQQKFKWRCENACETLRSILTPAEFAPMASFIEKKKLKCIRNNTPKQEKKINHSLVKRALGTFHTETNVVFGITITNYTQYEPCEVESIQARTSSTNKAPLQCKIGCAVHIRYIISTNEDVQYEQGILSVRMMIWSTSKAHRRQ